MGIHPKIHFGLFGSEFSLHPAHAILNLGYTESGDAVSPSRRLLLVDADPDVHRLLTGLLKREDRSIQDVYDGREALGRVRSAPYDLVVAGQGGNGFDGLKLLRRMREIRPETKVILTGEENPACVIRAIRERAYSYFHEPFPEGALCDMVQQALESSSW